ncbi:MAG: 1-phosphofructokinase [Chloroflexota bacterium]
MSAIRRRSRADLGCAGELISTITLNPALDNTVAVRRLVVEDVNRWTSFRRDPGGKGIGVSRVFHKLGGHTLAYGFIGGHAGRVVETLLAREKVNCAFVHIRHETRTNIIVTDLETNQQTRLDAPGPRVSPRELEALRRRIRRMSPRPSFLVMSGSVPPGVPDDIYAEFIRVARGMGVKAVLDSDGVWLQEGLRAKPYMVKPNVHETARLLGTDLETEDDIVAAALELHGRGVAIVVISRGRDGLVATDGLRVVRAAPPPVNVRSSVGAGDAMVAGLVLRLCQGASLVEACRLGVAAGSAAVLTPGTQLCRRRDVERLLPLVRVEEIRQHCDRTV